MNVTLDTKISGFAGKCSEWRFRCSGAVLRWRAILNYLSKEYLAEGGSGSTFQWTVAAEPWRGADASVLENDPIAKKIIAAWQRWCGDRKQHLIDVAGGEVDRLFIIEGVVGV